MDIIATIKLKTELDLFYSQKELIRLIRFIL
jgi:hypothetical protein